MNLKKNDDQKSMHEKASILQERARMLAKEPKARSERENEIEILEFMLSEECYAIETTYIEEVYPLKELTPLPTTPDFVLGIVNLRGRIVSVIDIKKFFDFPEKGITDLNKVILLHHGGMEFGILADLIIGVKLLPVNELQASLPTLTGIRAEYLKGITRTREIVLDAVKLLTDSTIVVNEEVAG
jgi:purine-binding chemotaxis protein CheW